MSVKQTNEKIANIRHMANDQVREDVVKYNAKAILLASMLDDGYITVERTSKEGGMTDAEWENFTSSPMYTK